MTSADFDYLTALVSHIKFEQLGFQTANAFTSKYHERASITLVSKLLLYGGHFVSVPVATQEEITIMLNDGDIFRGDVTVVDAGDDLYDEEIFCQLTDDPSKFKIFRGYALHADGGWRPHTWIYDEDEDVVIDHIKRRKAYYGVETNVVGPDGDSDDEYEADSIINDDDTSSLYGDAWSPGTSMRATSDGLKRH